MKNRAKRTAVHRRCYPVFADEFFGGWQICVDGDICTGTRVRIRFGIASMGVQSLGQYGGMGRKDRKICSLSGGSGVVIGFVSTLDNGSNHPVREVDMDLRKDSTESLGGLHGSAAPASGKVLEVVFTWDDGREEVRYRRPFPSPEAWKFIGQVRTSRERAIQCRYESPYSWRIV